MQHCWPPTAKEPLTAATVFKDGEKKGDQDPIEQETDSLKKDTGFFFSERNKIFFYKKEKQNKNKYKTKTTNQPGV